MPVTGQHPADNADPNPLQGVRQLLREYESDIQARLYQGQVIDEVTHCDVRFVGFGEFNQQPAGAS